jgi:hypothetical protein
MTRKAPIIQSRGKRHSLSRKNAEQLQSAISLDFRNLA